MRKFKIGEKVRIKRTGFIGTIDGWYPGTQLNQWYSIKELDCPEQESELKPYRPSRAGTRDARTGRFVSQYGIKGFCSMIESMRTTPEKIEKLDSNIWHSTGRYDEVVNQLIDAHYALEEKVRELEKKI